MAGLSLPDAGVPGLYCARAVAYRALRAILNIKYYLFRKLAAARGRRRGGSKRFRLKEARRRIGSDGSAGTRAAGLPGLAEDDRRRVRGCYGMILCDMARAGRAWLPWGG